MLSWVEHKKFYYNLGAWEVGRQIQTQLAEDTWYIIGMAHQVRQSNGERGGLVVRASDSGERGQEFDPHSGRRVVSLSKTQFTPQKYW